MTLLRTLAEETIPDRLRSYIVSSLKRFFLPPSSQLTLIIDQFCGPTSNEIYQAAHIYLPTKISPSHDRIQVSKPSKQSNSTITLPKGAQVEDSFRNIRLQWKPVDDRKLFFELSFDKQFIEIVLESVLPYVIAMSKDVKEEDEEVKIYTRKYATHKTVSWDSIHLHHPATFESLAMDPDQKKAIMEDLERFTERKELYKKIGKTWKGGYLLYGPSGTGKSSLIAAMANHLKFDIYDLEFTRIINHRHLMSILLSIPRRSIIVIEDIDRIDSGLVSNSKLYHI